MNILKLNDLKNKIDILIADYNKFYEKFHFCDYLSTVMFQQKLTDAAIALANVIKREFFYWLSGRVINPKMPCVPHHVVTASCS